jgi:hypothetical protein
MRRAETDTCYVYSSNHRGETYYGFRRVDEVGDDWYTDETYFVGSEYIDYEDASWTGYIARRIDGDKIISKKDYNRIKDMVENARSSIMESLKKVAQKRERELQVGDYLFCYDEYHEVNERLQMEWHDVSSVCYKILEISDSGYKVIKSLIISKYSLDFKEVEKEYTDEYGIEKIEGSLLIDEAQYAKAIVATKDVRDKVIEKIRKLL